MKVGHGRELLAFFCYSIFMFWLACFWVGVVLASVSYLNGKKDWVNYLLVLLATFVFWGIGMLDSKTNVTDLSIYYFMLVPYTAMFFYQFQDKVLPFVSQSTVLIYTVIMWFLIFVSNDVSYTSNIFVILVAFTVFGLVASFLSSSLGIWSQIVSYLWYLIVNLALLVYSFIPALSMLFNRPTTDIFNEIKIASLGMTFLFFANNIWAIFYLVPIPGKSQSWEDRMVAWKSLVCSMRDRFLEHSKNFWVVAIPAMIAGLFLIGNELFGVVHRNIAISFVVSASMFWTNFGVKLES